MHNTKVILALLTTAIVAVRGQDLSNDDIPNECRQVCQPVIQLEDQCDMQFDDDDNDDNDDDDNNNNNNNINNNNNNGNSNQQYRDCVCQGMNAQQAFQTCNDCVVQYPQFFMDNDDDDGNDPNDMDDNEVEQWMRICNFQMNGTGPMTSGTQNMPSQTGTQSLTTSTIVFTYPDDDDDDDDNNDLETSTIVSVFPVGATPTLPPNAQTGNQQQGGQMTSYSSIATTDQQGNPTTVATPVSTFDGAGAVATAAPILGAGAAILFAGLAL